ncbi:MAG: DUF1674 domain-containing protein [Gammaproteobacteria bacterium]|uniref:DUF1674 domain-containing protein n=1 Tax=Luteimonas sp. JM171 TaxID=1896164 RepID=UPI000BA33A4A|nr:DUF1674 domain-containing protein [Luteimonas sp. JM171]NLC60564.1 DUF1674 domain-containing protein [Gammaproteobacteria bacterium]NLG60562.1 DUF1674 domain-containing protein [Gammaproteobacteria bacterium]
MGAGLKLNGVKDTAIIGDTAPAPEPAGPAKPEQDPPRPKEIGGRGGPDPTRYGDWEKNGRCIDF